MDFGTINHELEQYLNQHTSSLGTVLDELTRHTYLTTYNPRMISGPIQGMFLQLICRMIRPKRILEIGTFTGFTTICMANAIEEDCTIDTIEINDELQETIETFLEKAQVSYKVNLIIGDALTEIPHLPDLYDLIYIDGEKEEYPGYLKLCVEKLNINGFLIADNVLWGGKVLSYEFIDSKTNAIRIFNKMIQEDETLENVLLSIRDGMMIVRKKK